MEFSLSDDPGDAGRKALFDLIEVFNDAASGVAEPARPLALLVRDPATGAVRGGLRAVSYWGWLFVELLFLPAELRGAGLGTKLMLAAEAESRRRGLRGVWLDTFSFQARPFYERLGYRVFGRIDDYPPGHSRFFLAKRLDGGTALAEKAAAQATERGT